MLDFIFLLTPGAVTYLIANRNHNHSNQSGGSALIELIAYSGIDMGIFWLLRIWSGNASLSIIDTEANYLNYQGNLFFFSLAVAVVVGILMAFLKMLNPEFHIIQTQKSRWQSFNPRMKQLLKRLAIVVIICIAAVFLIKPIISNRLLEQSKTKCKQTATALLPDVKETVANALENGTSVDALSDLTVHNLTIRKVTVDQNWNTGTTKGAEEAVYMVDGYGNVVYFSYRNTNYTATWSGSTEDEEFRTSHKGWNGGKGYGWTGTSMN